MWFWHYVFPPPLFQKFFCLPLRSWLEWNILGKEFKDFSAYWLEKFAVFVGDSGIGGIIIFLIIILSLLNSNCQSFIMSSKSWV